MTPLEAQLRLYDAIHTVESTDDAHAALQLLLLVEESDHPDDCRTWLYTWLADQLESGS